MSSFKRTSMILVLALAVAASAWAQRGGKGGMGMMGSLPKMPGLSNPVVGSGAEYQMTAKGKDMDVAWAIVGKEDVNGSPGIWMETRMQSADMGGEMVTKMLMVTTGPEAGMKRMIMQQPGQPPMEMGGMMMGMMKGGQPQPSSWQSGLRRTGGYGNHHRPRWHLRVSTLSQAGEERDRRLLGFGPGHALRHGEDDRSGHDHGVKENPDQRNHPHQGRAAEDADARNAALLGCILTFTTATRAGISGPRPMRRGGLPYTPDVRPIHFRVDPAIFG